MVDVLACAQAFDDLLFLIDSVRRNDNGDVAPCCAPRPLLLCWGANETRTSDSRVPGFDRSCFPSTMRADKLLLTVSEGNWWYANVKLKLDRSLVRSSFHITR